MPQSVVAPSGRQAAWLGTGLLIAVGVVLYQMTSLVLAPGSSRQISLSLRTAGHEPAFPTQAEHGPALDGVLAVSYRAAAKPAANQLRHAPRSSGIRSSSARRPVLPPAPLSVPTVTPAETPVVPRVDPKQDTHDGDEGNGGRRGEHD
jgi:hypothetical protein